MENEFSKPVILLIIEGFGLSSLWRGNAIRSANPETFNRLWESYSHLALSPLVPDQNLIDYRTTPELSYSSIVHGVSMPSNRGRVNNVLEHGDFVNNQVLHEVFDTTKKHNSALHLIGVLSRNEEYGSVDHLLAIIDQAKANRVFRIYIHLLIDNSYPTKDEYNFQLKKLLSKLDTTGPGEVITLAGLGKANIDAVSYRNSVVGTKGRKVIDPTQIIKRLMNPIDQSELIALSDKPDTGIKEFDSVIFFNHNNSSMENVISAFTRLSSGGHKLRYASIYTLSETQNRDLGIRVILPKDPIGVSIFQRMEKNGLSSLLITKLSDEQYFCDHLNDGESFSNKGYLSEKNIVENTTQIIDFIENAMTKSISLIVLPIRDVYLATKSNDLKSTETAIRSVDKLMFTLEKLVKERDCTLLIASPFGAADEMVAERRDVVDNNKSNTVNPVPFIVVSNNSLISSKNNFLSEILAPKYSISFIYRFLSLIFGISK